MKEVDVAVSALIPAPRDAVARFAGDPSNAPVWYVNIKAAEWRSAAVVAEGSKIAFVAHFLGRRMAYTYEIEELVPGERMVMGTVDGPFPMETTYHWSDAPGGTLMRLRNRGKPAGFSALLAPVMQLAMRRAMTKDLAALRAHFER